MSGQTPEIPLRTALKWIVAVTVLVSGGYLLGFSYYRYVRQTYAQDSKYNIVAIVQSTDEKERLKTVYLAELLALSMDRPSNLYKFSSKEAKLRLLQSPLIRTAEVKKIKPGTIYVDYTLRKPIAFLKEYSNTVIDDEGVAFPFKPFFAPKNIPEIILGNNTEGIPNEFKWGACLSGPEIKLALALYKILTEHCCEGDTSMKRIDVSKAYSTHYGQREIVLILEEKIEKDHRLFVMPRLLRLSVEHMDGQLARYLALRKHLNSAGLKDYDSSTASQVQVPTIIIDLRIQHLAFISKSE